MSAEGRIESWGVPLLTEMDSSETWRRQRDYTAKIRLDLEMLTWEAKSDKLQVSFVLKQSKMWARIPLTTNDWFLYCNSTVPRKGRMLYIFFFLLDSAKVVLKLAICWLNSFWGFTLTLIGHKELGITMVSPFCTNSLILPIFEQNFPPKYSESTLVPISIF